jgi:hypothetical protein
MTMSPHDEATIVVCAWFIALAFAFSVMGWI